MLAADTASLRDALRWATDWAIPSSGFGRFALKAQTNVVGNTIALAGVNLELDGNVGEGVLTLTGDGRKTLQGTLAADALDLTPYISSARVLSSGDQSWNRRTIVLDGLNGVDLDLRLSAARVSMGDDNESQAEALLEMHQLELGLAAQLLVERGERLVEQ